MLPWCNACFTPLAAAAMQVSTAAHMPAGQLGIGGRSKSDEQTPLKVESLAGEQALLCWRHLLPPIACQHMSERLRFARTALFHHVSKAVNVRRDPNIMGMQATLKCGTALPHPGSRAEASLLTTGTRLAAIAAGAEHSLAVSAHPGEVFAWGSPGGGRLGMRPERSLLNSGRQAEPRLVRGLVGIRISSVQCGHQHSGEAATLSCVGVEPHAVPAGVCHVARGQDVRWPASVIGFKGFLYSPQPLEEGLQQSLSFAAALWLAAAVTAEGQAYLWGSNRFSQASTLAWRPNLCLRLKSSCCLPSCSELNHLSTWRSVSTRRP